MPTKSQLTLSLSRALRTTALLCLFAFTLLVSAPEADAQASNPTLITTHGHGDFLIPSAVKFSIFDICYVGAGPTLAEAEANALEGIRSEYFIFSYVTQNPLCTQVEFPFGSGQTIDLCSIEVCAVGHRKFWRLGS